MSSFQINLALISKFGIIQWIVEHVFEREKSEEKNYACPCQGRTWPLLLKLLQLTQGSVKICFM